MTETPGRKLGLVAATALVMGTMIGSGVFLLPASLAPFGWNGVGGWVLTIAGALVLAKILADLTRHHVGKGNATAFVRTAFGPVPEFLVAWAYLVSCWSGIVAIAVAAVSYLSSLAPSVAASKTSTILWALGIVWALTLVNLRSVQAAGKLQTLALMLKLVPLLLVVVLAVGAIAGGARPPAFDASTISFSALNGAATLTLFALLGFECTSIAAHQVENPERTVPLATMWGTTLTGLIYLAVCSAVALLLPTELAADSPAPIAAFVERFWAPGPAALVAAFAVASGIGAINGLTLVNGELTRSMAADGLLPKWLGATGPAGTPRRALIVSGLIMTALGLLNASSAMQKLFEFLLLLTTSASLWLYLAIALAAFRLRVSRGLAVIGAVYSLWALWGADLVASGLSLALMFAGLPLYWWAQSARKSAEQPV